MLTSKSVAWDDLTWLAGLWLVNTSGHLLTPSQTAWVSIPKFRSERPVWIVSVNSLLHEYYPDLLPFSLTTTPLLIFGLPLLLLLPLSLSSALSVHLSSIMFSMCPAHCNLLPITLIFRCFVGYLILILSPSFLSTSSVFILFKIGNIFVPLLGISWHRNYQQPFTTFTTFPSTGQQVDYSCLVYVVLLGHSPVRYQTKT